MTNLEELTKKFDAAPAEVDGLWTIKDLVGWVEKQDYLFAETKQTALDFVVQYVLGGTRHRGDDLIHIVFDPLITSVPPAAVVVGKQMWDRDFLKEAYLRAFEIVYSSGSSQITARARTELFTGLVNFVAKAASETKRAEELIEG